MYIAMYIYGTYLIEQPCFSRKQWKMYCIHEHTDKIQIRSNMNERYKMFYATFTTFIIINVCKTQFLSTMRVKRIIRGNMNKIRFIMY